MIDFDSISTGDWKRIYEILEDDKHLSELGKKELKRLEGYIDCPKCIDRVETIRINGLNDITLNIDGTLNVSSIRGHCVICGLRVMAK